MSLSKQHCEQIADFQVQNKLPIPTPAQFLLAHGSIMQTHGKTPRQLGIPKQCYRNAYHLARRRKRLRYAEGFALSVIPLEHAWCVDEDGHIVDPTWGESSSLPPSLRRDTPTDYFGMTFDLDLVRQVRKISKSWSVLWNFWHWREVYPILKAKT